jgi:surface polysaccharide O-acyltransferase-like enzyme
MARNINLDLLKFVLSMMVVGIHALFLVDIDWSLYDIVVNYVFRIAVPIFFMINGYFALKVVQSPQAFGKWFLSLLGLYVVWTAIYTPYFYNPNMKPIDWLSLIFIGYFHLWYVPATAFAGFFFFLLFRLNGAKLGLWSIGFMAMCFLVGLSLQYMGNLHIWPKTDLDKWLNHLPVYRNALTFALPCFGAGLWLAQFQSKDGLSFSKTTIIFVIGMVCMAAEYSLNKALGINEGFDLLWSLPFLTIGLFSLALALPRPQNQKYTEISPVSAKAAAFMSDASVVIYFLHPIILKTISPYGQGATVNTVLVIFSCILATPLIVFINKGFKRWLRLRLI